MRDWQQGSKAPYIKENPTGSLFNNRQKRKEKRSGCRGVKRGRARLKGKPKRKRLLHDLKGRGNMGGKKSFGRRFGNESHIEDGEREKLDHLSLRKRR